MGASNDSYIIPPFSLALAGLAIACAPVDAATNRLQRVRAADAR